MELLLWLSSCGALPGGSLHGEQKRGNGEGTVQHDEGEEGVHHDRKLLKGECR